MFLCLVDILESLVDMSLKTLKETKPKEIKLKQTKLKQIKLKQIKLNQNQAQVLILAQKKDLMFKQKSQILRIDFKEEELAVEPLCLFKMFLLNLQEYPLHQNKKLFQLQ